MALPVDWQTSFQPSASPVMDQIESFHKELLYIITFVSLFVAGLLGWVVLKFRASVNPIPMARENGCGFRSVYHPTNGCSSEAVN